MSKRIGILGGIGPFSTLDFYSSIIRKYEDRFHDLNYPEMVIYSLSHGPFKECEDRKEDLRYKQYIMLGVKTLISAKVECLAFAAVSAHRVVEEIRNEISVPVISALDSVANHAARKGVRKALLLGIKFTMQSDFFQRRLARENIHLITPEINEQDQIQRIIHGELVHSVVKDESRKKIMDIIRRYEVRTVILGCNRLPILLHQDQEDIEFINSMDVHTSDVLDFSLQ